MSDLPRFQRVAAYAVIIRDGHVLLSRLAPRISREELWTLPGGGVDHGEHPRDAVIREIEEETGLNALVSDTARVFSAHLPGVPRDGRIVDGHAIRIVYDGWVARDSPEPHVVEVGGSTVEAKWIRLDEVESGAVPTVGMVKEALAEHEPFTLQRPAAYALISRSGAEGFEVLLTRISARGYLAGSWTLPGGGIDQGESPALALAREVMEECGVPCAVGELLGVHDVHFSGTATSGRFEDYHGIHLLFNASVAPDVTPRVVELDGTTDAVEWIAVEAVRSGDVPVLDVVTHAIGLAGL